ncbi:MAG TPA: hypothetical protein VMF08_21715 [Candidatus Sulfotelmatobacter sp.]|nr:hypothetical protein [Candidatus Sulfotelmatobacter sp.]
MLRTLAQSAKALKTKAHILLLAFIPILFTGCATIIDGGGAQPVRFRSNPNGAKVTIYDNRGRVVAVNATPTTVSLKRGGMFRSRQYRVDFELAGFQPFQTRIQPTVNPWYFGNFLLLPLSPIGFLVDPVTGGMWRIRPGTISCNLAPLAQTVPEQLKVAGVNWH